MVGTILGHKFTFATVYAPNTRQLTFLDSLLESLSHFREGQLILGGDFNISPDPKLDTSAGRSTHSFAFLKHFRKTLQSHHLVDCWRVLHSTDKDFSYYSATHAVYTSTDMVMMDQFSLETLSSASIGSITLSDHAPVSIPIHPIAPETRSWTSRLNENILDDAVASKSVSDAISQ